LVLFLSARAAAPRARKASQRLPEGNPRCGASLRLLPPLSPRGNGLHAQPVFQRKEGRKPRCRGLRSSPKEKVMTMHPFRYQLWRHPPRTRAGKDRPQDHRGTCGQHQDRWLLHNLSSVRLRAKARASVFRSSAVRGDSTPSNFWKIAASCRRISRSRGGPRRPVEGPDAAHCHGREFAAAEHDAS